MNNDDNKTNFHSKKIDTKIGGVRVMIGMCNNAPLPDTENFTFFVEDSFAHISSTNNRMCRLMHDIGSTTPTLASTKSKDKIELENSRFIEYMSQIIQITKDYKSTELSIVSEPPPPVKPYVLLSDDTILRP